MPQVLFSSEDASLESRFQELMYGQNMRVSSFEKVDRTRKEQEQAEWLATSTSSKPFAVHHHQSGGVHQLVARGRDVESHTYEGASLEYVTSLFIQDCLKSSLDSLTCRQDQEVLSRFVRSDGSMNLTVRGFDWILANPFISRLKAESYGNLLRFLFNQRGLFLKVWEFHSQKNYWNSSLNGGLPLVRKRDPIHEGVFLFHDLCHFTFRDPIISGTENINEVRAYLAYRIMSEACTLVLADMCSVEASGIDAEGYDTAKRKVFPLLKSMHRRMDWDFLISLMWANVVFCLTGNPSEFAALGGTNQELSEYVGKYEVYFSEDLRWNHYNISHVITKSHLSPAITRYWQALSPNISAWNNHKLLRRVLTGEGKISVTKLFSFFVRQLQQAFSYQRDLDESRFSRVASLKYMSGQIKVAFDFPNHDLSGGIIQRYQDYSHGLAAMTDAEMRSSYDQLSNQVIEMIENLGEEKQILPHQRSEYKLHVPQFPPIYINYDVPGRLYQSLSGLNKQIFEDRLDFG